MSPEQLHLTEDEMDEALIGTASADRAAHLVSCALCAAKFAEFNSAMANFNQASSAWSEAKSNALTRDLHQHRTSFRITSSAIWSCASAMVIAVGLLLGLGIHQRADESAALQANVSWAQSQSQLSKDVSRGEIASDDAMLRQIDAAINNAEPSPEVLYGPATSADVTRQSSAQSQARN